MVAEMAAKNVPEFDPQSFLSKVGSGRSVATYQNKKPIFAQGDVADSVFYIQKGKVKLTVISQHGKDAVVAMLNKGEFFGEGCMVGQHVRLATATAVEESEVMRLDKSAITLVLHNEPAFADLFIK